MTAIVAVLLAFLFNGLKPIHDVNEANYNKRAILGAVAGQLPNPLKEMSDDQVASVFSNSIKQKVVNLDGQLVDAAAVEALGYKGGQAENIDMKKEKKKADADKVLPVFEFSSDDGKQFYIVQVRGNGLWDEIWGNIALEKDLNTIAGVSFDHQAETPGLGAEIKDNAAFQEQFIGKKLYDSNGVYKSVFVRKGGAKDPVHEVDGISGATITADGVTEMMGRGMKYYEKFFNSIKG